LFCRATEKPKRGSGSWEGLPVERENSLGRKKPMRVAVT
jgi:hypothetical protein